MQRVKMVQNDPSKQKPEFRQAAQRGKNWENWERSAAVSAALLSLCLLSVIQ